VKLTVLHCNPNALEFYTKKLKYEIAEESPSACGESAPHEILEKCINRAAVEALQGAAGGRE
jgi:hypothetical protein